MTELSGGSIGLAAGALRPGRVADNRRAAALMILSTATIVCNDALMKAVTVTMPLYQAVVLRGLFILPLLLIFARWRGQPRLRLSRQDARTTFWRSVGDVSATICYLLALRQMALADLSAVFQSLPLVVTLAAAAFCGERLDARRLLAIGLGFLGVLVVLRPATSAFDIWSVLVLASVVLIAWRDLLSRRLSDEVPSLTIAIYASLAVLIVGLAMLPGDGWAPVSAKELAMLFFSAFFWSVACISAIATVRIGEISVIAPFRYTALVWAILLGILVFGDWPGGWTLLGAALIVAAGLGSIWAEGRQTEAN